MKRTVFGFVLGVIFTSIISIVAYSYNAKDIVYTPSNTNWKVNSVKDAIDDIKTNYHKLDTPITASISDIKSGKTVYNNNGELITGNYETAFTHFDNVYYKGDRKSLTLSKSLNKGNYIISVAYSEALNSGANADNYQDNTIGSLSCTSCQISKLHGKLFSKSSSASPASGVRMASNMEHHLYYVSVTSQSDTVVLTTSRTNNNTIATIGDIEVVKID